MNNPFRTLFLIFCIFIALRFTANAQDTVKSNQGIEFSGSADVYYKYDFAGGKAANIPTVFANESNSVSIGMLDLTMKKQTGRASFVGEISFGPRSDESIPSVTGPANDTHYYNIQNLYISYDLTSKLNLSAGYMSTFIGYETVVPTGNFNYSTSYLNTNGPFQNAGLRAVYTFSEKVSLLAGIFDDRYNAYSAIRDVSTVGVQAVLTPVDGFNINLSWANGYQSGTTFDISSNYQVTGDLKFGLNATNFKSTRYLGTGGYDGVALYTQYQVIKNITLGIRGEYYEAKDGMLILPGPLPGNHVKAITLSANIKAGALMLIPEVRHDEASDAIFINSAHNSVNYASEALLALVYSF
ncbi:MAG: outer membrane beta-barrel protein [Mucilaginibacter sp.]